MSTMSTHFDVHVFTLGMDHALSEDCWCEPSKSYWVPAKDGKTMLHVLEHNDVRSTDEEAAWSGHILDSLGKD